MVGRGWVQSPSVGASCAPEICWTAGCGACLPAAGPRCPSPSAPLSAGRAHMRTGGSSPAVRAAGVGSGREHVGRGKPWGGLRRGARGVGARPVLSVADQWYNNHENAHLRTDAGVDSRARGSRIQLLIAAVRCRAEAPPSIPDPSHTPCKEFHSCAFFPGCVPHSQLHSADAWRPGSSASCACAHSSVSTPGVSGTKDDAPRTVDCQA